MKSKYVRKMLSFMLAAAMTCQACVPAFAEDVIPEEGVLEEISVDDEADSFIDEAEAEEETAVFGEDEAENTADMFDGLIEDEDAFEPAVSAYAEKQANRFESVELDGMEADPPEILSWYSGGTPSEPTGKALYGTDTMYFKWCSADEIVYKGDDEEEIDLDAMENGVLQPYDITNDNGGYPTEEGEYIAIAYIDETDDYEGIKSDIITFSVLAKGNVDISKYDAVAVNTEDEQDESSTAGYEGGNAILTVDGKRIWSDAMEGKTDPEGNECITTLEDADYTGEEITKNIIIQDVASSLEPVALTEGTDYEVTYSDNINAGEATITITGLTENVTGTIVKKFNINKIAPTISVEPTEATEKFPNEMTYAVTTDSDGEISAASSDESIATVSVLGTTVTVTPVDTGSVTIAVSQAEGTNWTASTEDVTVNAVIENGDMVITVPEDEERGYTGTGGDFRDNSG